MWSIAPLSEPSAAARALHRLCLYVIQILLLYLVIIFISPPNLCFERFVAAYILALVSLVEIVCLWQAELWGFR